LGHVRIGSIRSHAKTQAENGLEKVGHILISRLIGMWLFASGGAGRGTAVTFRSTAPALNSITVCLAGPQFSLDLIPNKRQGGDPFENPYVSGGCKSLGFST